MRVHAQGRRRASGFTLVELLVVLAVIALLIAMLMPALKKAKLAADGIKCANNLRTLMTAFRMFAEDHKGCMPGNKHESDNLAKKGPGAAGAPWPPTESWRIDWLNGRLTGNAFISEAPTKGTIWPYVRNKRVYSCPTQEANLGNVGMFAGANERFDYSYFNCFSGNKLNKVKNRAKFKDNHAGGTITYVPTPILVQEHEVSINGANMEGGHSESDKMASCHNGGSYYASVDGSVHFFIEYFQPGIAPADRGNQPNTARKSWQLEGPVSRKPQDMGFDAYWGQWDTM